MVLSSTPPLTLSRRWTQLRPHQEQFRLWNSPARFKVVVAGRRSGKTELAKRNLVRVLALKSKYDDPRFFYGAPTYDQAKLIAWRDLYGLIPKHWVEKVYEGHSIRTIFGSEVHIVGLDRPQRIEGVPWDGCVIDESSDIKPGTFDLNVYPALADRVGWCWRIGVPKRAGIGAIEYKQAFDYGVEARQRAEARGEKSTTIDAFHWFSSTVLDPSIIEHAKKTLSPKDYREQFEASWETESGLIYYCFKEQENVRPCAYNPKMQICVSCDFNIDPMAWVLGHVYSPLRVEWFDEIFERNINTPQTLDVLWRRYPEHTAGWKFFGDAAASQRKTSSSSSDYQLILSDSRFTAAGRTVHFPRSNPAVVDRYASCNAMFCNAEGQRRMFIDPKCKKLIDTLKSDCYKEGTRDPLDGGDRLHITDAMGYLVWYTCPIAELSETLNPMDRFGV